MARLVLLWAAVVAIFAQPAAAEPGRLVIVGGGLSLDNAPVYRAFLDSRPEDAPSVAIISAASGYPSASAATFAGELMFYGVAPEDIVVVELAAVDDPETEDVDESQWASNASDPEEIAKIERAGAIWFTGGDQLRLGRTLVTADGGDTPMLSAIRARLTVGAVVGGTSAGAAIMSDPTIVRGSPFEALFRQGELPSTEADEETDEPPAAPEPLVMTKGLDLFEVALVDQHFGERGRLARLVPAVMRMPVERRVGIGIDEDTALSVDLESGQADVLGRGRVTLLDGRQARVSPEGFSRIAVSRLHDGDSLDLAALTVSPDSERVEISGRQSIYGGLYRSVDLLDPLGTEDRALYHDERRGQSDAEFIARLREARREAVFTFEADRETRYWRSGDDEGWNGTMTGISLSVETGPAGPQRPR